MTKAHTVLAGSLLLALSLAACVGSDPLLVAREETLSNDNSLPTTGAQSTDGGVAPVLGINTALDASDDATKAMTTPFCQSPDAAACDCCLGNACGKRVFVSTYDGDGDMCCPAGVDAGGYGCMWI